MSEQNKYRLKARALLNKWSVSRAVSLQSPDKLTLEDAILDAISESAREAMERTAEIAESHMKSSDYAFLYCMKPIKEIVEAIRKEAKNG